jgi:hypothetical protein
MIEQRGSPQLRISHKRQELIITTIITITSRLGKSGKS